MIKSRHADGGVGMLEEPLGLDSPVRETPTSSSRHKESSPDQILTRPTLPQPANQLEYAAVTALRARYAEYRSAEARAMVRVCVAAAYASALRVPYWMAYSTRDYVTSMLGVKPSTYYRWVKIGEVLLARPELRDLVHAGVYSMCGLAQMAKEDGGGRVPAAYDRSCGAGADTMGTPYMGAAAGTGTTETASEASGDARTTASADDDFVPLSISAPIPAVLYIEESMHFARGIVGTNHGDEDALSAILAEAATEATLRVDVAVAKRRFRVRDKGMASGGATSAMGSEGPGGTISTPQIEANSGAASAINSSVADDQSAIETANAREQRACTHTNVATNPRPLLPIPRNETAQRSAAHRVHAILARLISRRDRLRVRLSDQLFEWQIEGLHERSGFSNFERFALEILDLPFGTCRQWLRHTRQRRRNNAIAISIRDGRISAVQAELLERLYRSCQIPSSDLERWCQYAHRHTVRKLRKALRWAKQQADLDYRRWSLAYCRPPEDEELRTMQQSLETLAKDSGTEQLSEALVRWEIAPRGVVRLFIRRETRDELLIQMASMQDELRGQGEFFPPKRIPEWFALCLVCHRAREAWRIHHRSPPAPQRRILDRDGYECAAPECTQRRNLHVHHVDYRSHGGGDEDSNRVTLCAFHHIQGEHGGLIRVSGTVDEHGRGLIWEMGLDENGRAQRIYRNDRVLSGSRAQP